MSNLNDRLKIARGNASRQEFAEALNVSSSTLVRYESGESIPDANFIRQLCELYRIRADWLILGKDPVTATPEMCDEESASEFCTVPLVEAKLSAGDGSFIDSSKVIDKLAFKRAWINSKGKIKNLVLMRVRGDSMEPIVHDQDLTLIDTSKTEPYPGALFAIGFDGAIYIKRLFQEPGKLILRSENDIYSDITINLNDETDVESIKIIGRAVWWCHDEVVR